MAHQSRGDPAKGSFLSAQASTSPQQHNVADCALARTDMFLLAKLVTWSYLTLGRQGTCSPTVCLGGGRTRNIWWIALMVITRSHSFREAVSQNIGSTWRLKIQNIKFNIKTNIMAQVQNLYKFSSSNTKFGREFRLLYSSEYKLQIRLSHYTWLFFVVPWKI